MSNKEISLKKVKFKNLTPYNYQKFLKQLYNESLLLGETGEIFFEMIDDARVLRKEYKKSLKKLKVVKSRQTIKKYESKLNLINSILQDNLAKIVKDANAQNLNFRITLKGGEFSYSFDKSTFEFLNSSYFHKFSYIVNALGFTFLEDGGSEEKLKRLEQLIDDLWNGDKKQFNIDKEKYFQYINDNHEQHPEYVDKSKLRK